jgi:hypothetical protein
MTTASIIDPSQRQILVNLGNRYVVFGPSPGLPQPIQCHPETDSEVLPRVADESEVAETRIAQTLRVAGMKRTAVEEANQADFELLDDEGNRVLIDIKRPVRRRNLASHALGGWGVVASHLNKSPKLKQFQVASPRRAGRVTTAA